MLNIERHNIIMEILEKKKNATVEYLSSILYTSCATVRRDLTFLEKSGLVKRTHGGVILIDNTSNELPHIIRENTNKRKKVLLCNAALNFITNSYSLFLDSSSTVLNLVPFLNKFENLTVITNGVRTALDLIRTTTANVYISGGHIKQGSTSVVGTYANCFIKEFSPDIAIISCHALNRGGVYEADEQQTHVKRQMLQNVKKTILLCDDSKFGVSCLFRLCGFESITAVITNAPPPPEISSVIENSGCELIVCSK